MDENIKVAIEKIKLLSKKNLEFAEEMHRLFGETDEKPDLPNYLYISDNVVAIRSALEIRANVSINYDFVKEQRLRDQLIVDNLRMENAALNLKEAEADRFYTFCVNAFYQIENIVNYYYHRNYSNINKLLDEIEKYTQSEKDEFKFKKTGKEKNVASIRVADKINAFCNRLIPDDKLLKWRIGTLRQVRNEGEHRCAIVREERDEANNLYRFLKNNTFNNVRADLIKFVSVAKQGVQNSQNNVEQEGVISKKLPGACFVLINEKTIALPPKLFTKIKSLGEGDKINLVLKGDEILDINAKKLEEESKALTF